MCALERSGENALSKLGLSSEKAVYEDGFVAVHSYLWIYHLCIFLFIIYIVHLIIFLSNAILWPPHAMS